MNTRLQVVENNFESQLASKCDLLIQIGAETISYAIIDKGHDQLKALFEATATITALDSLTAADPLLRYHYRKVKVSVNTTKFSFIPQEVYSEFYSQDYARFIRPKSASDLLVNDIRSFKIKNVIAVDSEIQSTLHSFFPTASIFDQATPFIEGSRKVSKDTNLNQLFLNIRTESFEAAIIQDGQLLFYNVFDSQLPDEFNYFLLLLIKQFKLDAFNTGVIITGAVDLNDPFYTRVMKYFNEVEFPDMSTLVRYNEIFESVSLVPYFSLLSLNLCE